MFYRWFKLGRSRALQTVAAAAAAAVVVDEAPDLSPPVWHQRWDWNWDRRQATSKSSCSAGRRQSRRRHLLLLRHGHYNEPGVDDESRVLTELGQRQARALGVRLAEILTERGVQPHQVTLVSSDLRRAKQTLALALEGARDAHLTLPCPEQAPANDALLNEGCPMSCEPAVGSFRPQATIFQEHSRIEAGMRRYVHRPSSVAGRDVPSDAPPDQPLDEDEYMVVFAHANVIRYFVVAALQLPMEAWLRLSLDHTSITWLTVTAAGDVFLNRYGDSGHLPVTELSSSMAGPTLPLVKPPPSA